MKHYFIDKPSFNPLKQNIHDLETSASNPGAAVEVMINDEITIYVSKQFINTYHEVFGTIDVLSDKKKVVQPQKEKPKVSVASNNKISGAFLRRFSGAGCQCGKQKFENFPLCGVCFNRLPGETKNALRQKKGGELEAVYNQAVEVLKGLRSNVRREPKQ